MSTQLDTPHRASSTSVSATAEPTAADKVMAAVKKDINRNIVLIPQDVFLECILINHITPVKRVVRAIMDESYDKNEKQWKEFPKTGKEDQFYPKFVELANNINDKASKLSGAAVDRAFGRWIDCHSQIPNANADFVAEIRPDCAFVSNERVVKEAIDSFTSRKIQETLFESNSEKQDAKIWWRQMIAVVEVKRQDGDQLYLGAFPQLCNYVRQIFRQQLDRRFVLGITISFNNISMWLCDRSGGMGMSKPYDIHEDPEAFVSMISAITLLPSYRIGWDPTLKLYNDARHIFQPSYQVRALLKTGLNTTSKTEQDISNTQWLLTLIDDRSSNKVQKHNIILARRPLLIRTAEGMNGRAVQIHQGYFEKDENKERRSPLVIKTSWQPVSKTQNNQPHEAYFYDLIPDFRGRILAASVVKASHGPEANSGPSEEVSTFGFIRQSLEKHADFDTGARMNNNVKKFSKQKARAGKTEHSADKKQIKEMKETMAFMAFDYSAFSDDHKYFAEDLSCVTDRVQTRIVLTIWGWPIKFFKDLRELLTVIQGAIEGSAFIRIKL
ncbi:hypothetical protein Clacol_004858 [Clathrus columnatus]|uniref:Fungal-type protein kinase domain-containing protein n=1 Tax=Clathrus columnatus TaxID=1419009 RepID=A0AAV5AC86_9AGAM|nr:hypothetical protein Clacol_004858 [Clathrus columnatus]